jgi:hypothetical protein
MMMKYDHSGKSVLSLDAFVALCKDLKAKNLKSDKSLMKDVFKSSKKKEKEKRAKEYIIQQERSAALAAGGKLPTNAVTHAPLPTSAHAAVLSILGLLMDGDASVDYPRLAPPKSLIDTKLVPQLLELLPTRSDYSNFTPADLPSLTTSLTQYLSSNYAPLIPYTLCNVVLTSPKKLDAYSLWFRSPELTPERRIFLLNFLTCISYIIERDDDVYYRQLCELCYKSSGITDVDLINDKISADLEKYKGREESLFSRLSTQFSIRNPWNSDNTPFHKSSAILQNVLFRAREDTDGKHGNIISLEDVKEVLRFVLNTGTLDHLKKNGMPQPETSSESFTPTRVFKLCDKDSSGSLDVDELEYALTSVLGKIVSHDDILALMKKYDADNSGTLDLEEFIQFSNELKNIKKSSFLGSMFKSKTKKEMEKAVVEQERIKLIHREQTLLNQNTPADCHVIDVDHFKKNKTKTNTNDNNTNSASNATTGDNADNGGLPYISKQIYTSIMVLLKHVTSYTTAEVGLYRVSGDANATKSLLGMVMSGDVIDSSALDDLSGSDVHVVCSVIKKVLSNSKPVVPYGLFGPLLRCVTCDDVQLLFINNSEECLWRKEDVELLKMLMRHVDDVSRDEKYNKMGVEQLFVTLGQNFTRKDEELPVDLMEAGKETKEKIRVLKLIYDNRTVLFGDDDDDGGDDGGDDNDAKTATATLNTTKADNDNDTDNDVQMLDGKLSTTINNDVSQTNADNDNDNDNDHNNGNVKENDMTLADITLDQTTTRDNQNHNNSVVEPTPDQLSLKVYWKKGSNDEPSNEEEVAEVFEQFGEVKKVGLKPKAAAVQFTTVEACNNALENYKGPWKIKAFKSLTVDTTVNLDNTTNTVMDTTGVVDETAGVVDVEAEPAVVDLDEEQKPAATVERAVEEPQSTTSEQPKSTTSSKASSNTPTSTKLNVLMADMEERSIKISWKSTAFASSPPTQEQLEGAFRQYGEIDKVIIREKNAVMIFKSSSEAVAAETNYAGLFKVRVVANTSGATSKTSKIKTMHVSPKPQAQESAPNAPTNANESVWLDVDTASSPKYELKPLKTPPSKQKLGGGGDESTDAFSAAFSAAQKILEGASANQSPVISNFNRMEVSTKQQKAASTIEKLVLKVEEYEEKLGRATRLIQKMNAESAAEQLKQSSKIKEKEDFERSWEEESMVLRIQLKEAETSNSEARKQLIEKERNVQTLQAELQSLERTAKTIEIVREKAYESAKNEVGHLLAMQESRLESQGIEIATSAQAQKSLTSENEKLSEQYQQACTELVAWRTRAEASELELKDLGLYASTKEEKRALEIARLLNSKVVGVGLTVDDLPVAAGRDAVGSPKRRAMDTSSASWGVDVGGEYKEGDEFLDSRYSSPTRLPVAQARARAEKAVLTSSDVLKEAWSAQKALAERLDREIYLAGFKLEQSLVASANTSLTAMQGVGSGMGFYQPPRAWSTGRR